MDLNPNIILSGKPADPPNPLAMATQALNLKDLAAKSQINQYQMQQAMAQRQAAANSITTDESGNPQFDQKNYLNQMAKINPAGLQQAQQEQGQMSLEQLKNHNDMAQQLMQSVPTGADVAPDQKQSAWSKAINIAKANGLPQADKMPDQYPGDSFVNNLQMHLLNAKDQIELQQKGQDLAIRQEEANIKEKQFPADQLKNTSNALETARGSPDIARAHQNLLSNANINSLVGQAKDADPNNLSPTQVGLLAHETLKMATGGTGTEDELKSIKPNTPEFKLAEIYQGLKNAPSGAQAAPFIKDLQNYSNSIAEDSRQYINNKNTKVIESNRYLAKPDAANLKKQWIESPPTQSANQNANNSAPDHSLQDLIAEKARRQAASQVANK